MQEIELTASLKTCFKGLSDDETRQIRLEGTVGISFTLRSSSLSFSRGPNLNPPPVPYLPAAGVRNGCHIFIYIVCKLSLLR